MYNPVKQLPGGQRSNNKKPWFSLATTFSETPSFKMLPSSPSDGFSISLLVHKCIEKLMNLEYLFTNSCKHKDDHLQRRLLDLSKFQLLYLMFKIRNPLKMRFRKIFMRLCICLCISSESIGVAEELNGLILSKQGLLKRGVISSMTNVSSR